MSTTWHGYRRSRARRRPAPRRPAFRHRHVADRDALADGPVLRTIAVMPQPPSPEPVHPGSRGEVLLMEGCLSECVDVGLGRGLGEGDLAGRRPRREGVRHLSGPGGDPRADGRQARAALARAEAGLARALQELELGVSGVPGGREVGPVVPIQPQTTPSVGGGSGWREPRVADHRDGTSRPCVRVARGEGRYRRWRCRPGWSSQSARGIGGDDSGRWPSVPSKRTGLADDRRGRSETGFSELLRGSGGHDPGEPLPGQTGWISAAPVAMTISSGCTWSMPCAVRTTIIGPA